MCTKADSNGVAIKMRRNPLLRENPKDNVAIALSDLVKGQKIKQFDMELTVEEEIPMGHKIALTDFNQDEEVIKYGYPIGTTYKSIPKGFWIHKHNTQTHLRTEKKDYKYKPDFENPKPEKDEIPEFNGYRRKNGSVGVRNEIWIIPTVGCINKIVEGITESAKKKYRSEIKERKIDGIFCFTHPYGCSQLDEDLDNTQNILAGLVKHPNAAGVLVVGLGCEKNQIKDFKEKIGEFNSNRVRFVILQEVENDTKSCIKEIDKLVEYARGFDQEPIPVSELKIGVKCGGSDSFSGLTANPLLGEISNMVIDYGGTSIITEIPELFGSEKFLSNKAKNKELHKKIISSIQEFEDYYLSHGKNIYENPSPGNEKGGITTEEEKALGSVRKIGTRAIKDVVGYGNEVKIKGANLLESVSNDIVSTTALTAAGAQIILFTTGRGTPHGAPAPTVKISTNSSLYQKKTNWIDFDAGRILKGEKMENLADEFFKLILNIASNKKKTKSEKNGCREISIFKSGVTL